MDEIERKCGAYWMQIVHDSKKFWSRIQNGMKIEEDDFLIWFDLEQIMFTR